MSNGKEYVTPKESKPNAESEKLTMKRRIDRGGNQGRDDPRSAAADRARLRKLWPLLALAAALLLFSFLWS